MTPEERARAFDSARRKQLREYARLTRSARADIVQALEQLLADINSTLNSAPSEWEAHHLTKLRQQVNLAITRFEQAAEDRWLSASQQYWEAGAALVDVPLKAAGVTAMASLPAISDRQLLGMRSFLTDRVKDISNQARTRINAQLLATIAGGQTPAQTVSRIQGIIGSSRSRAITITRTELGRAFSTASQLRLSQARQQVTGLKKQWRRSGKLHSRLDHDAVDGQIQEVEEPFTIGEVKLMYPRDPTGPAKHTINCGCTSLPYKDDWATSQPTRAPFSQGEVSANPLRGELDVTTPLPAPAPWRSKNVKGSPTDVILTRTPQLRTVARFLQRHKVKTILVKSSEMRPRSKAASRVRDDVRSYLGEEAPDLGSGFEVRSGRVQPLGFTSQRWNHVTVKVASGDDFTKADPEKLKDLVATTLQARNPWTFTDGLADDSLEGKAVTWLHELGHQVHFKTGLSKPPPGARAATQYSGYNDKEWHAEHFVAWALDRQAYAQYDPAGAAHFDVLMKVYEADDGN